jgi:hypothetical protein
VKAALLRLIVAVLLGLVALARAGTAHAQLLSPGPLAPQHASLEGDQHCSDCHTSGKRVDQGGCLKCHGDVGAKINAGQGLHGRQYKGKACEGCHIEHLGKGLTRWPGGDPAKLDHSQTGWTLEGAHQKVPCAKCHNKSNSRGAHTYLGLSTACVSCHKDVHNGRFDNKCVSCHNEVSWKELNLKTFNHDQARFPLRGAHQTVACAKCHQGEPPKYLPIKFEACTDCHKDPHAGKLGAACTNCHEDTKWKPVTFKGGNMKHPGVSLANGHAPLTCQQCHDKGNLVTPSRGKECVSCHKPSHKAPFGRGCAACHATIQWMGLPHGVGIASHGKTEFPLTGKHLTANCAGCHKPQLPREARYRKLTFARCADCHADNHKGEFARLDRGECKACHATAGFRPTLFNAASHFSTAFPLVGKHGAVACSACHVNPRPRVDLHVKKKACAECHENPHGTQFAAEMAQGGCAHCHQPIGWKLPKIDHSTWPLTGVHATAMCESCHHPTAEDRKSGRGSSYKGVPRNCYGCHDDVHLGQFRLTAPVVDCDKCHTPKAFKIPTFDHLAGAGWALTGEHAKLECAKCHRATKLKDESVTTRWRLPSSDCKFCHANPHEPRGAAR